MRRIDKPFFPFYLGFKKLDDSIQNCKYIFDSLSCFNHFFLIYKSPPPFLSRSSELFQSPYFLNRYLNILYCCKFYYCRDHNDYGIRYKDLLDDLVDLKLQYLLDEIEKILNKWQIKSATEFLEQTHDGTIEEGEDDAITLTHLLDQREELFQLKAQWNQEQ